MPLIMSVARVMGTAPWRMLSSRSFTGAAKKGARLAGLGVAGEERERHGAGTFESGVVEPLAQTCQFRGAGGIARARAAVVCAAGGAWAGDSAGCHGRILSAWG